ncbi:MAG: response regulator [Oscillatoria princeps RMCB-10]|jgi:two-component system chemotaxis response regulator CheY|nr:response regulator [Oscillatoria princeps RMCB-10]
MKILVVDDSPTMRRMVISSLRELQNVQFEEASNGLEAVEQLAIGHLKQAPVNLIILDLNMPDIHGMEVLKFVRSYEFYSSIPVIVLTTRNDGTSRSAALAAGASSYMTKPFQPQTLIAQANSFLN